MKRQVRFTFVADRSNRTGFAVLTAALEDVCDETSLRLTTPDEVTSLDFGDLPEVVDIVAFSAMTVTFDTALRVMRRLKAARPEGSFVTICGGSHASALPREVLKAGFDYCCVGEGEEVLRQIVLNVRSSGVIGCIDGLVRRTDGEIEKVARAPLVDIDAYPALPLRRSFPTYIEVGRGCRWGCAYCQTPRLHGSVERFRSGRSVEEVVAAYSRFGMKDFRLLLPNALGYCSSTPKAPNCDALEDLLGRVHRAAEGSVYFGSFPSEIRPDYVTPEAIEILRRYVANRRLVIGGQAASEQLLRAIGRNHGIGEIRYACEVVQRFGFEASVDIILGFPGETADDRQVTFAFMQDLGRKGVKFNVHFFLPLPGTPLSDSPPAFLKQTEHRQLDRLAQQGIVRGRWRRQEEIAKAWLSRREDTSPCQ